MCQLYLHNVATLPLEKLICGFGQFCPICSANRTVKSTSKLKDKTSERFFTVAYYCTVARWVNITAEICKPIDHSHLMSWCDTGRWWRSGGNILNFSFCPGCVEAHCVRSCIEWFKDGRTLNVVLSEQDRIICIVNVCEQECSTLTFALSAPIGLWPISFL